MDQFSAGLLLSAAVSGTNPDKVADLYKEIATGSGPTREDIEKIEALIGKRCLVSWNIPGVIVGVNTSKGGFYGGERYPLLVRQDKTGQVFEYDFNGFSLIED